MDKALLRLAKHRDDYQRISAELPMEALDGVTREIMGDFGKYFEDFPKHSTVDMDIFLPRFRRAHNIGDDKWNGYLTVFAGVVQDIPPEDRDVILHDMMELALGTKVANLVAAFSEGDVENLAGDVENLVLGYKRGLGLRTNTWIDDDIGDILAEEHDASGVRFRLDALSKNIRGTRPGDFIIVAGRPDKGKTTFLSSEVTFMAPQLPEDRNVIWLNNEGPGRRIVPRLYQAALGLTTTEMVERHSAGKLVPAYRDRVGRLDRVRVIDVHGMAHYQIEQILEQNNPGVVVFDMIDNVRGFADSARDDQRLERMYQWGRELAVKMNFIGLPTSQISAEGDGLQYPPQSALKDSKTGKQGACDMIITLGAVNDPSLAGIRYIGTPKNKLGLPGKPSYVQEPVAIRPDIARYEDIEIQTMEAS